MSYEEMLFVKDSRKFVGEYTPIQLAVKNKNTEVAETILKSASNETEVNLLLNSRDFYGYTVLLLAIINKQEDFIRFLLSKYKKNIDLSVRRVIRGDIVYDDKKDIKYGEDAFELALKYGISQDIIEELISEDKITEEAIALSERFKKIKKGSRNYGPVIKFIKKNLLQNIRKLPILFDCKLKNGETIANSYEQQVRNICELFHTELPISLQKKDQAQQDNDLSSAISSMDDELSSKTEDPFLASGK